MSYIKVVLDYFNILWDILTYLKPCIKIYLVYYAAMKTKCEINGCEKKHMARGLCVSHYLVARARGDFGVTKKCGYPKCENQHYAKGYCHKHYEINRRNGSPTPKAEIVRICSVPGCGERTTPLSEHCKFHMIRKQKGKDLNRPKGNSGKLNHMWKGGVAQYPNHYEMKKNRIIVLEMADYRCHFCGKAATQVHHKDLSKDNHSIENLLPVCRKCNGIHRKPSTSKYKRLYGGNLKEIASILGCSPVTVMKLHNENRLRIHIPIPKEVAAVLW